MPVDARPRPWFLRGGESWRNPWDDYRWLRDHDPVHLVEDERVGRYVVLSRHREVFDAVRDTETFSSARGLSLDPDESALFEGRAAPIVMMDPPEHTTVRRIVAAPMTPSRVATFEQEIRAFVDGRLDRVADADGGEVDIVKVLLKPLPSFVVAHYLGVPAADRGRFDLWTRAIVAANASGSVTSAGDALFELMVYAGELIDRRRREPGDDLVSRLVESGSIDAEWIVGFVFTMVAGGNDTTTGLLGGALELLHHAPDQRSRLSAEPAAVRESIDELLRLTSPVQNLARTATRDVEILGVPVAEGQKVMLLFASANRDQREYGPDADRLDLDRRPARILSFGYGAHHCLGAAVARLAGSVALERLFERFPHHQVDPSRGTYAPGAYVRRYESLPFHA